MDLAWFLTIWSAGILIVEVDALSKCGNNKITRLIDDKRFKCWPCPACQEGRGSSVECGHTVSFTTVIECVLCKPGVSFSDHIGESQCQFCGVCLPNEEVVENCTPTSNIKCGKCKKGFYRAMAGDCISCAIVSDDNTMSETNRAKCFADGILNNSSSIIQPSTTSFHLRKMGSTPTAPLSTVTAPTSSTYKAMQQAQSTVHRTDTKGLTIATSTVITATSTLSSNFTAVRNFVEKEQKKKQNLTAYEVLGYLFLGFTAFFLILISRTVMVYCYRRKRFQTRYDCVPLDRTILSNKKRTNYIEDINGSPVAAPLLNKVEDCPRVSFVAADMHIDQCSDEGDSSSSEEGTSGIHIITNPGYASRPRCPSIKRDRKFEPQMAEMLEKLNETEFQSLLKRVPEDIYISDLPDHEDLKKDVEMILDTPSPLPGWRQLGLEFGMNEIRLNYLETEFLRQNGSPTSQILEFLKGKYYNVMTVRTLVEGIHHINRDDIVTYICKWKWEESCRSEVVV